MKIGILLTNGFGSESPRTVRKLAEAALRRGHQVEIFLMDDGVYCAPMFADLGMGTLCAHNAEQRGLSSVEGVVGGSQYDWAQTVNSADRVIVFGG